MSVADRRPRAWGTRRAVVIGGSLVGGSAAIMLHRAGWDVTVLERSSRDSTAEGSGIGVDRRLLARLIGGDARSLPALQRSFEQTTWSLVHDFVMERLRATPAIHLRRGSRVKRVDPAGFVTLEVASGSEAQTADLVVGADGYASTARAAVAPEHPDARYAGYLMWRGLIEEHQLVTGFSDSDLDFAERRVHGARLVTFGVPGAAGEVEPGARRASFSWFDPTATAMLRHLAPLRDHVTTATLRGTDVPDGVLRELIEATRHWPRPWGPAIRARLSERRFIGTPISEYLPDRLTRGRIALIGDAAQAGRPDPTAPRQSFEA